MRQVQSVKSRAGELDEGKDANDAETYTCEEVVEWGNTVHRNVGKRVARRSMYKSIYVLYCRRTHATKIKRPLFDDHRLTNGRLHTI